MQQSSTDVSRLPYLSVPAWDISEEELAEWKQTPGMQFTAYTAQCIMDGKYDGGQEVYPESSGIYREIARVTVDRLLTLLAERGMARKSNGRWYAISPGRQEPSVRRALAVLLARRPDLPPSLAAELDSWKLTLDALASGQQPAAQQPGPARARQARGAASAGEQVRGAAPAGARAGRPAAPARTGAAR